jgi:hypothetical protein
LANAGQSALDVERRKDRLRERVADSHQLSDPFCRAKFDTFRSKNDQISFSLKAVDFQRFSDIGFSQ